MMLKALLLFTFAALATSVLADSSNHCELCLMVRILRKPLPPSHPLPSCDFDKDLMLLCQHVKPGAQVVDGLEMDTEEGVCDALCTALGHFPYCDHFCSVLTNDLMDAMKRLVKSTP
jgi:hypothetical protein